MEGKAKNNTYTVPECFSPECRFGVHHDGSSHDIREVTYDCETNLEIPYAIIMSKLETEAK